MCIQDGSQQYGCRDTGRTALPYEAWQCRSRQQCGRNYKSGHRRRYVRRGHHRRWCCLCFSGGSGACKSLWSATAKECRANGIDPGAEQDFFKVIYGMETCLLRPTPESRDKGGYSIVLLVQNEIGNRNLYHLITASPQRAPLIVLITRQKKNCHKRQFLNGCGDRT